MDEKHRNTNYSGIVANIMISVLLIVVGGSLLFIPGMKILYFTYICAGFLLVWGVSMAVRYFAKDEYRIVSNYDFAVGVIVLLLAVCFIVRAKEVSSFFHLFLGILILIEGVVLLQHTIQMKQLKGILWFVIFVMAVFLIAFAMIVLMNLTKVLDQTSDLYYGLLMAAGGLGILSQILVGVRASKFKKDEEKAFWENAGDAISYDTENQRRVPRNVNVGTGNMDFLNAAEGVDTDASGEQDTSSASSETANTPGESNPSEEKTESSDANGSEEPVSSDNTDLMNKTQKDPSAADFPENENSDDEDSSVQPAPWTDADEDLFRQIKSNQKDPSGKGGEEGKEKPRKHRFGKKSEK